MAVNYADAKKKALARDPKTAVCLDYGDAWFFAPKAGGIGDGMVVMKNNGEVKPMFMVTSWHRSIATAGVAMRRSSSSGMLSLPA